MYPSESLLGYILGVATSASVDNVTTPLYKMVFWELKTRENWLGLFT